MEVNKIQTTENAGTAGLHKVATDTKMISTFGTEIVDENKDAEPKKYDYNQYGKDPANFSKFKGNDKYDAMSVTSTAANSIRSQMMDLERDFPGITLALDDMPDPEACGKKREGFGLYKQQLSEWISNCTHQISNARIKATQDMVNKAVSDINNNTDRNAAAIISNDNKNAEMIIEENAKAIEEDGAATRANVKTAAIALGTMVQAGVNITTLEAEKVVNEVKISRIDNRIEHIKTNATVTSESGKIQDTVEKEADKTRAKIDEQTEILDPTGVKRGINKGKKKVRDKQGI